MSEEIIELDFEESIEDVEEEVIEDVEEEAIEHVEERIGDRRNHEMDDDGRRPRRAGTLMTAIVYIITALIGSGVLSLTWGVAQLGWVVGLLVLMAFASVTFFTSTLLVGCYRYPGPVSGHRNYTYMGVVRSRLGGVNAHLCALIQYVNLFGVNIGYTIAAANSMVNILRSNNFHKDGNIDVTHSPYPFMITFGVIQILISQLPHFRDLRNLFWLSALAAVMSFSYSSIGFGISIAKCLEPRNNVKTTLTGVVVGVDVVDEVHKIWRQLRAIGNIAFAYGYSNILIEIQDTLRSSPAESKVMRRASLIGVMTTTIFYMLCGISGYAAFGNKAPGNMLSGFGFFEPFWLTDVANICIFIHLVGAYQVFCQPIFGVVEKKCARKWPGSNFIIEEHDIHIPYYGVFHVNLFRLTWRTCYILLMSLIAMFFPFLYSFLGLMGATFFYPLTVYFPIEMHIDQNYVPRYSRRWIWLKLLSAFFFLGSILGGIGSIIVLLHDVKKTSFFS